MTDEVKQKQMADEKIENLNTLPTPVLAIDTDFTITYMNRSWAGFTAPSSNGMRAWSRSTRWW
jgi:nitrogen-specific signal transduction histidine kinase